MRQSHRHVASRSSSADLHLDPSETPIRGPGAKRKTATAATRSEYRAPAGNVSGRGTAWSSNNEFKVPDTVSNRAGNLLPSSSAPKSVSKSSNITRHFAPNVGNNGYKQNMSSNSESDQTDTDSCNVTGPQKPGFLANQGKPFNNKINYTGEKLVTKSQNIPVIRSSDTDNDFPTTDFNNPDEMNDLNRTGGKNAVAASTPVFPVRQQNSSEPIAKKQSDSSSVLNDDSSLSKMTSVSSSVPVLRKKVYSDNQTDSQIDTENTPEDKTDVAQPVATYARNERSNSYMTRYTTDNASDKGPPYGTSVKSKDINTPGLLNFKQPQVFPLPSSSDDFEDDLLFDAPSDKHSLTHRPSEGPGTQSRVPKNPSLQPEIPAVLPAKSTELASFSQSPRWNMNKNHNNIQPQQHMQTGFRPSPVRTVPKDASKGDNSHSNEQQLGNDFRAQQRDEVVAEDNKRSLHLIGKPKQNYPGQAGAGVGGRNRGQAWEEKGKSDLGDSAKEPISANWFATPADLDTHLAKSVSDGVLKLGGSAKTESDSVRNTSKNVCTDETSLKREIDRNRSIHSEDGNISAQSDSKISARSNGRQKSQLSKVDKEKVNYQNSEFSKQGYFSDSAMRNAFTSVRPRVVHSPVTVREASNRSPVIKDFVSHSPVHIDSSQPSTLGSDDGLNSDMGVNDQSGNGSVKTEKLQPGACFSPIHPQPVTTSSKQARTSAVLSKDVLHPTPVSKPGQQGDQKDPDHLVDLK